MYSPAPECGVYVPSESAGVQTLAIQPRALRKFCGWFYPRVPRTTTPSVGRNSSRYPPNRRPNRSRPPNLDNSRLEALPDPRDISSSNHVMTLAGAAAHSDTRLEPQQLARERQPNHQTCPWASGRVAPRVFGIPSSRRTTTIVSRLGPPECCRFSEPSRPSGFRL